MSKQFWDKCPKSPCHPSSPVVEIDGVLCCSHEGCYKAVQTFIVASPTTPIPPVRSYYDGKEIEQDEPRREGCREAVEMPDE